MHIFYLTPYVPTPIRVRPYCLLRALARRGHAITLLCVAQGDGLLSHRPSALEEAALAELRALGIRATAVLLPRWRSLLNCLAALPTRTPLQAVYCWSPALARRLGAELGTVSPRFTRHAAPLSSRRTPDPTPRPKRYDVLHIEHLRAARYGRQLGTFNLQLPIIWDSVDCISHLFAQSAERSRSLFGRLVTRIELPRTRRYEARLLRAFDRTLVTSPLDAAAFAALPPAPPTPLPEHCAPSPEPFILPNGVDLGHFHPDSTPRLPAEIVFSGKMSYHANVTAALYLVGEVLPLVRRQRPDAHVTLAGSEPPAAVQSLAGPQVTVTGYVADLRPYLRQAAVAIAPMPYGAGIQNKVLEAMACGTPVVATPQAISALEVRDGAEILVGATAAELAAHVVALLNDPARAQQIGQAGRAYVERNHDWDAIAGRLEQVYREEIARPGGP